MKIEDEIKQSRFESNQQRLLINILFTANQFSLSHNRSLRQFNISTQQFNVLKILKGQKGNPISVKDMFGRMLDKSSNVSRLIDKLLLKKLIKRVVDKDDRRRVNVSITKSGLLLLKDIDVVMRKINIDIRSVITDEEARIASGILDKFRIINQI